MPAKKRKSDLYGTLGVPREASVQDIKRAYRARAKQSHPDHGGSAAEFAEVKRAQVILLDPERRARYDSTGDAEEQQPDQSRARTLQLIATLLAQMLADENAPDLTKIDLVAGMKRALQTGIDDLKKAQSKLRAQVRRAEKLNGRFKADGPVNVLDQMLDSHLWALRRAEVDLYEKIGDRQRAIELLGDYRFKRDIEPMFRQAHFGFGSVVSPTAGF